MIKLFKSIVLTLTVTAAVLGQPAKHTENSADLALQSSGRVNPSTLGMEIDIPLGNYPGRGINVPISLSYSSKVWRMEFSGDTPGPGGDPTCRSLNDPTYAENTASGWTTSLSVPYIEYVGKDNVFTTQGYPFTLFSTCGDKSKGDSAFVRRIVVHLPGGETHELRADDTPITFANSTNEHLNQANWNGWFYAVDGSNLKYHELAHPWNGEYRLRMPDGSYYDFADTSGDVRRRYATTFTDRNGVNQIIYNANETVTDTLGRTLSPPLPATAPSNPTPSASPQVYTMPGLTGQAPITYKFHWKQLKGSSPYPESGLTDFSQSLKFRGQHIAIGQNGIWSTHSDPNTFLFGSLPEPGSTAYAVGGHELFNPVVLTKIELPTGQNYEFRYDVYGRIEKITYPTGGEEVFTYGVVLPLTPAIPNSISDIANFGVTTRRVYETSGGPFYQWTYSAPVYVGPPAYPTAGYKLTTTNPDNTQTQRILHRGNDFNPIFNLGTFGFDNVLGGMPYEESVYTTAQTLISRKLTNWTKTSFAPAGVASADWHPRVTQEKFETYDNSSVGVSTTTDYGYEGNLNLRETPVLTKTTAQYAFVPVVSPPPLTLMRSTENTFLINDPNYSSVRQVYIDQNMQGLVTVAKVKNAAGIVVAQTENVYDEVNLGLSPGQRGFVTTAKAWDKLGTDPSSFISTQAKFNSWGNQTEATDARGFTTFTAYDTTHNAFPVTVTSPIPDPTDTYGSLAAFITTTVFDAGTVPETGTGLPLSTTDANGLKTAIEYDPATLRPRFTRSFINGTTQVGSTSETIYNDTAGNVFVRNRSQIDVAGNWAETKTYFDGLGRAWKTEEVNTNGNIFVVKQFDAQGRVSQVSNPYRIGETVKWTTNGYDFASRVTSVTLPDGATVGTEYGVSTTEPVGVTKQITDQAQKKRKGFTDALGNMVRVVEDPTGQNLETDYVFDVIGNLRKTTQGTQIRYFMHDSLGRLLFAKQPEQDVNASLVGTDLVTGNTQWTAKYGYDANGNIASTTDARNQTITAQYDRLNRLQIRDYVTDTAMPDVQFYYDGKGLPSAPTFSKGRTTKVYTSVSTTEYNLFDEFGRVKRSKQITDGVTYGDDTNPMTYEYNLSGTLTEQKYPSGRVVKTTLDANGDLSQVQSKKNASSSFATYADSFTYNSAGAMTVMKLGNGKWESAQYNDRQQIKQISLGNSATDTSLLKLEFSYNTVGQTNNNGSMLEQKITVPTVGSNPGFTGIQTYTYDSLNRLYSARETVAGSQTWMQTFLIDRYGNREYDPNPTVTTTIGSCVAQVCNPDINADGNNRFSPGQGYSYDANGNVTQDAASQRFHYDAENHQKSFFSSGNPGGTPDWTYSYDGDGRRIKKASATEQTVFVYDAMGKMIAEYSSALSATPQISYLTADHLGSPRITTNQSGAVTNRKDFMAYGEEALSSQRVSGPNGNGYQTSSPTRKDYTGYEKDSESQLEFAQARYFNPTIGRYTSVDPLTASASIRDPQTFNRYSYVVNSPYKFTDPLGLLSVNSIACGMCGNESLYVDGSAFRGTDTSFDWAKPTQRTVYVFISLSATEQSRETMATTETKKGGKVVSTETSKVTLIAPADFAKLPGVDSNTKVVIKGPEATLDDFKAALQDNNAAAVVFIGHGVGNFATGPSGLVFQAYAIEIGDPANGAYYNQDNKVDVKAAAVILMGCDTKSVAGLFSGASNVITVDSGTDGLTALPGLALAGYEAARAVIKRQNPAQITAQANVGLSKASGAGSLKFKGQRINYKADSSFAGDRVVMSK